MIGSDGRDTRIRSHPGRPPERRRAPHPEPGYPGVSGRRAQSISACRTCLLQEVGDVQVVVVGRDGTGPAIGRTGATGGAAAGAGVAAGAWCGWPFP